MPFPATSALPPPSCPSPAPSPPPPLESNFLRCRTLGLGPCLTSGIEPTNVHSPSCPGWPACGGLQSNHPATASAEPAKNNSGTGWRSRSRSRWSVLNSFEIPKGKTRRTNFTLTKYVGVTRIQRKIHLQKRAAGVSTQLTKMSIETPNLSNSQMTR